MVGKFFYQNNHVIELSFRSGVAAASFSSAVCMSAHRSSRVTLTHTLTNAHTHTGTLVTKPHCLLRGISYPAATCLLLASIKYSPSLGLSLASYQSSCF